MLVELRYPAASLIVWMILVFAGNPCSAAGLTRILDPGETTANISIPPVREYDNDTPERVWYMDFEGNRAFSGMTLRNIIALESPDLLRKLRFWNRSGFDFSSNELRRDEIRIQRFYQRRGFPHVRVSSTVERGRRNWVRRITFYIEEGKPTQIVSVSYRYDASPETVEYLEQQRSFRRAQSRQVMQEGRRHELIQYSEVEGLFLSVMRNAGFAHAEVHVTAQVDSFGREAQVLITLNPGPLSYLGEIHVEGVQTVSPSLVLRHSELSSGSLYRSGDLRNAQQQIFGHPLFRFVTVNMPPQDRDSIVDISIRVREHALRSLRIQAGLGLEEIARLGISWEHRNPFGNAHHFSTSTRVSFLEQRVNMDYHVPFVFNAKSRINVSPFGQRLDERGYLLYRAGINNSFIYQISRESAATFSYEFTRNQEQLRGSEVVLPEDKQRYDISALKLSGYHNKLELEQYQGWVFRPYAEFSGFLGTGALRYNRYMLDVRRYQDLGSSTQLAVRNEWGLITYSGLDQLPSNVRFYTGGTSSVRGWQRRELGPKRAVLDEDGLFLEYLPTGGKALFHFNFEVRQDLKRLLNRLGMALFIDGGAVWQEADEISTGEIQFGLGGGLRYQSPVGPIRIDLARKLNPTDEDLNIYKGVDYGRPFDRWGIHFSIGQSF